jgi:hypothetical protein
MRTASARPHQRLMLGYLLMLALCLVGIATMSAQARPTAALATGARGSQPAASDTPRSFFGATTISGGRIYVMGGSQRQSAGPYLDLNQAYSPKDGTWLMLASMPTPTPAPFTTPVGGQPPAATPTPPATPAPSPTPTPAPNLTPTAIPVPVTSPGPGTGGGSPWGFLFAALIALAAIVGSVVLFSAPRGSGTAPDSPPPPAPQPGAPTGPDAPTQPGL